MWFGLRRVSPTIGTESADAVARMRTSAPWTAGSAIDERRIALMFSFISSGMHLTIPKRRLILRRVVAEIG
jgi:hypothetical protein